jgi:hypothetical protein
MEPGYPDQMLPSRAKYTYENVLMLAIVSIIAGTSVIQAATKPFPFHTPDRGCGALLGHSMALF